MPLIPHAPFIVLEGTFNNQKGYKGTFSEYSAITSKVSMSKWGSLLIRRVTLVSVCDHVRCDGYVWQCRAGHKLIRASRRGRFEPGLQSRSEGRNAPPKNWLNAGPSRKKRNKRTIFSQSVFTITEKAPSNRGLHRDYENRLWKPMDFLQHYN